MKKIQWKYGEDELPTREQIAALQREWGVIFPKDYVDVVLAHDGAAPVPSDIDVPGYRRSPTTVDALIRVVGDPNDPDSLNLRNSYSWIKDRLPPMVFPFARTPGPDKFCFDFRQGAEPTIVYWYQETATVQNPDAGLFPLAKSFSAMLAMLR